MTEKPRILVKDLHKEFVLRHGGTLKSKIMRREVPRKVAKEVLKGINLEVHRRECVAIVGRNGAGKSTLLAILAKVHKPTSGYVEVHGRVAPLLELGAGFHPDLTGVDNIFFNGMLLGLTREQIHDRLEEIIDFAELRDSIESPLRTYSSGMVGRLGFAVASHVNAETMIVDESLSAGDFSFVKKCMERLAKFRSRGGTILFVSHSADSVRRLADRCLWLDGGVVRMDGDPNEVLAAYQGTPTI